MSQGATTVTALRPEVDDRVVEALKEWLALAERGELVGAVLLGNFAGVEVSHRWAGRMPLDRALIAFEYFKRDAL
jgi:hypothetical protein